jgi:hypothetical protein
MSQSNLNFKDRFGLDFLGPARPPEASKLGGNVSGVSGNVSGPDTQLPLGMEAVLKSLGGQILTAMKAQPDQTSDLLGMAKLISMRLEAVLPIVQYLAENGLIERVVEDPTGNDTYKITLAGQKAKL